MKRVKVGLALGSGAARGVAHIGVLKALEENNIDIDVVAGTSIGAVVGGFYASGLTIKRMTEFAEKFGDRRLAYWMDPSFFMKGGLLKGDKIEQAIIEEIGPVDFSDLETPLYIVATDLITGDEVVISKGEVGRAIRASFAIPGIFAPVKYDERWLVDGAISEPIPTRILKEVECDVIIAVNVSSLYPERVPKSFLGEPKILDVMIHTLIVTQQKVSEPCMKRAHINIVPEVGAFDWTEFGKVEELIELGYAGTVKHISHIKKLISRRKKLFFFRRLFGT